MNKEATDALAKLAKGFEDLQAALADEQGAGTGDRIRGEQARQVSLAYTTDDKILLILRGCNKTIFCEIENEKEALEWVEAFQNVAKDIHKRDSKEAEE